MANIRKHKAAWQAACTSLKCTKCNHIKSTYPDRILNEAVKNQQQRTHLNIFKEYLSRTCAHSSLEHSI